MSALHKDSDNLSIEDGLVLLDARRIVIPIKAIPAILKHLHASHSGINKTSQPQNPMVTAPPSTHLGFPMQHIGLDLFNFNNAHYLICVSCN